MHLLYLSIREICLIFLVVIFETDRESDIFYGHRIHRLLFTYNYYRVDSYYICADYIFVNCNMGSLNIILHCITHATESIHQISYIMNC